MTLLKRETPINADATPMNADECGIGSVRALEIDSTFFIVIGGHRRSGLSAFIGVPRSRTAKRGTEEIRTC